MSFIDQGLYLVRGLAEVEEVGRRDAVSSTFKRLAPGCFCVVTQCNCVLLTHQHACAQLRQLGYEDSSRLVLVHVDSDCLVVLSLRSIQLLHLDLSLGLSRIKGNVLLEIPSLDEVYHVARLALLVDDLVLEKGSVLPEVVVLFHHLLVDARQLRAALDEGYFLHE